MLRTTDTVGSSCTAAATTANCLQTSPQAIAFVNPQITQINNATARVANVRGSKYIARTSLQAKHRENHIKPLTSTLPPITLKNDQQKNTNSAPYDLLVEQSPS